MSYFTGNYMTSFMLDPVQIPGPSTNTIPTWRDTLFTRLRQHAQTQNQSQNPDSHVYNTPSSDTLTLNESDDGTFTAEESEKALSACGLNDLDLSGDDVKPWRPHATYGAWLQEHGERARREWLAKKGLTPPAPPAPVGVTRFNPHAAPYVPAALRKQLIAEAAPAPPPEKCLWQVKPIWMRTFRSGTVTIDVSVRVAFAKEVVELGPRDHEGMAGLAVKFCERATDYALDLDPVAPYAKCMFESFRDDVSEPCAAMFKYHLQTCVGAEFTAWWRQDLPTAVAQHGPPRNAPVLPANLLQSAILIAKFVGDLFMHGLVSRAYVAYCLDMLVDNMTVIEELHAMYAIMSRCDARLYQEHVSDALIERVYTNAMMIRDNASVVGQLFSRAEIERCLRELSQLVRNWKASQNEISAQDTPRYVISNDNVPIAPTRIINTPLPPRLAALSNATAQTRQWTQM